MFKVKQLFIYFLTILFSLNCAFAIDWTENYNCNYIGVENLASNFQCDFTGDNFRLNIALSSPIDLTTMDFQSIKFQDNKIHFNHTNFNGKSVVFSYSNLNTYSFSPIYFRNDIVFSPSAPVFNNTLRTATYTQTINNLENYAISENSKLIITPTQTPYFNTTVDFTIQYLNTLTSAPISPKTCSYNLNSVVTSIPANTFQITFDNTQKIFSVQCSASGLETITLPQNILAVNQPIDNFSVDVSFIPYQGSITTFEDKNLSITINSDGTNNLLTKWNTKYSIGLSWDQITTNTNELLYGTWFEIGKNEIFSIYANSSEQITKTTIIPQLNLSHYLFRNEKDGQEQDKSLYLNVKACSTNFIGTQTCIYNHSNYFIFKDLTPPQITKSINNGFLKNNQNIEFSYTVFDYESGVDSLKYSIIENGSIPTEPIININNFNVNTPSQFTTSNANLENGKFYQFVFKAENGVSVQSSKILSDSFLIDTKAPINSSFKFNLNQFDYAFSNQTTIQLDPGFDYNLNYSSLNLTDSGLNHTKLQIIKHPLASNNCLTPVENISTYFYDTTQRTENFEFETGFCYEIKYSIFDKAGNERLIYSNQDIKIDTTIPTIIGQVDDGSNSKNFGFDQTNTIFQTTWNFEDTESGIRNYDAYLYKLNSSNVTQRYIVKSFENISNNYVDIKYNSSYIEDGGVYYVYVKATNRANLTTSTYQTNGITLFEKVAPELIITNDVILNGNGDIFDFINNGYTEVKFKDKNKLNVTCRYYANDVGYDVNFGTACSKNVDQITCNLPVDENVKLYNFHISCLNLDQIDSSRNKNTPDDNLDLNIYHEYNVKPNITQINYNSNYSTNSNLTNYNLLENESTVFSITALDDNVQNIFHTQYTFDNNESNLSKKIEVSLNLSTSFNPKNFRFIFNNNSPYPTPILQKNMFYFEFYFQNNMTKTQIENLLQSSGVTQFKVTGNNSSIFKQGYTINSSNYTTQNILGISNKIEILTNSSFNITKKEIGTNTYQFTYTPNQNQRLGSFKTNITYSDSLLNSPIEFEFNISPIYYMPKINQTYLNQNNGSNNILNLELNEETMIDLSNYIFEENSVVGLDGTLKYEITNLNSTSQNITTQNIKLNNYNPTSPILNLTILNNITLLNVKVTNVNNQSNYLNLNLNLSNYIIPQINITDELDSNLFNYTNRQNSNLEFNINSTKTLYNATLKINSEYFSICNICKNKTLIVDSNDLLIGQNEFEIIFIGKDNNPYIQTGFFNFSFVNQSTITNIEDSFLSNVPLEVKINNSNNLTNLINNDLNSTQNIQIIDNSTNKTLVEFNYDFSLDNLSIVGTKVLYNKQANISTILISNLNLETSSQSRRKTVSIKAPQDILTYNSVCIKDEQLNSISQISQNCNSNNEYFLKCDGSTTSAYSCNYNNVSSEYIISGLRHSGIKIFNSNDFVDPNSGGNSGGGSGGGSSGSGGSSGGRGSSGGSFNIDKKNDTTTIPIVKTPTKISITKFTNKQEKINFSQNYTISINNLDVVGTFLKLSGELIFIETSTNIKVFQITTNKESFDLDKDGFKESQIYYSTLGVSFYLNYELLQKPKENITITPKPDVTPEPEPKPDVTPEPKPDVPVEKSNLPLLIGLLVLICITFGAAFYFYKKKQDKKQTSNVENIYNNITPKQDLNNLQPITQTNYLIDKLKSDHNIVLLKLELEKLNKQGLSWTELYLYLKSEGLNKTQLNYLFTFDTLIKNIKEFCDLNKADSNIQNKIKNEFWIKDCFFYEKPIEQIIKDISFMLTGVNIYGFDETRFKNFFFSEMVVGVKYTKLSNNQKQYLDTEIKEKLFQFE